MDIILACETVIMTDQYFVTLALVSPEEERQAMEAFEEATSRLQYFEEER